MSPAVAIFLQFVLPMLVKEAPHILDALVRSWSAIRDDDDVKAGDAQKLVALIESDTNVA